MSSTYMKKAAFWLLVVFYLFAGANHFINPSFYSGLIPPYLPWHDLINIVSGIAEIVLAVLLLLPQTRILAAKGIIVLLIAFIPAHIYFIQINSCIPDGLCVPQWLGWVRLVLIHPILIAWAWWCRK
ncbi:hypothetical protein KACHI17_15760 [Sediminibacterium sp. KACHI17]|jgi:uncharacterized membrane protein|uniref:Methylamine utilisation protein MauE domain-containing protein n=1 Tax=Sediminibacterium sp. KACHI17 TaxID=1751071 RepID=A0AAT9GJK8_9BACT